MISPGPRQYVFTTTDLCEIFKDLLSASHQDGYKILSQGPVRDHARKCHTSFLTCVTYYMCDLPLKISYMAMCGFVALHLEIAGKLRKSIRPWNSLHKLPQRRAARGTKGLDNVRVPPLSFASYDTDCPRITPEAHWRRRNCALTVLSHAILQVRFVE